jgi:hypothetical protein
VRTHFIRVSNCPKYNLRDDDGSRTSKKNLQHSVSIDNRAGLKGNLHADASKKGHASDDQTSKNADVVRQ